MRFNILLHTNFSDRRIPINYQYPLSSAIYRIISKGDGEYAKFLHETGYGKKGFKLFTFSQINCPFKISGDRMELLTNELLFQVSFHLPEAMETFIKGLFLSEKVDIADSRSKVSFTVKSIERLPNLLGDSNEGEMINISTRPTSPIVAGVQNEKGYYDFLSPDNRLFTESLIHNWRSKISTCYDDATAESALLMMEVFSMKNPFKSRLITIKSGKPEETKIRGWLNLGLKITGERRFVELLLNAGTGVYSSQGMGFLESFSCDILPSTVTRT
ncbi:CRISPR-associated endoribonuclease Cas6 [Polluticaenibacter yanchengensis]|uniref:CRISPR-associated endoribonuclease Cas6 n=1 Tax=Polluticaenibacter yanchengensis TaxID=3014562 RepID=A0ABT4UPZ5_9BACT|nr:CRISPR-associated endoribonuclease Cas6 [Chitinophagaceae bacterium LY-5]